jgi:hypothetical protein
MDLTEIIQAIRSHKIRITSHADEETAADRLAMDGVSYAVLHGELIEDYPADRPYPSCFVLGRTPAGIAVHRVWA